MTVQDLPPPLHRDRLYHVTKPRTREVPVIFDSPHSGRDYPDDFGYACDFDMLRRAEDNDVDHLFDTVADVGGTLLCALFPRCYIDTNRAEDDIDVDLLSEKWPGPLRPSMRSYAGIGLIRRLVRPGVPVYDKQLSVRAIQHRIHNYYHPYHACLKHLIDDAHYRYGQVWHINCHSMPSAAAMTLPARGPFPAAPTVPPVFPAQPDFVLGDRDGTSCDIAFTHALRDFLRGLGYKVSVNNPYKGVELVRRYADPARGRNSIQIEINKALYWDEVKNKRNKNYNALKDDIDKLVTFSANYAEQHLVNLAAD